MDKTMDNVICQYNNQNSIYVLNSSSYEEFSHLNLIDDSFGSQLGLLTADTRNSNFTNNNFTKIENGGYASVPRNFQNKLKTLGNFNGVATEAIGNSVASSTSSTTCSPAAAAIQKLFNCSSAANVINISTNTNSSVNNCNNANNTNNKCTFSGSIDCKTIDADTRTVLGNCSNGYNHKYNNSHNSNQTVSVGGSVVGIGIANGNSGGGGGGGGCGIGVSTKKKCTNVKSTLIAKKTKFWKLLEEEKWRLNDDGIENLTTSNCERQTSDSISLCAPSTSTSYTSNGFAVDSNSCREKLTSDLESPALEQSMATDVTFNAKKFYTSNKAPTTSQLPSSNWSGSHDSSSSKQQEYQIQQSQQKSSHELYKEAAQLLGLSCTLCDNCRCLDCQSGYFDCDDSDSYSELSFMDEYDDDVVTSNLTELMMHTHNYADITTTYCNRQKEQSHECTDANCNMNVNDTNNGCVDDVLANNCHVIQHELELQAHQQDKMHICPESDVSPAHCHLEKNKANCTNRPERKCDLISTTSTTSAKAAIDELIREEKQIEQHQHLHQQSNELENCASFNELSLLDVKVKQHETITVISNASDDRNLQ
ncbi:uncharacterized protein DDB_G0283357 [Teleopsis dalmanni]|uniref:uncharacterized protein DDB_G0283357 n=1 Tax=Teleopsis dalmanni TaxID=139649 RepID=UPI0018CE9959|nr:uncharacterized protein DDB_G0283357 [Teleopsis dalmanni]